MWRRMRASLFISVPAMGVFFRPLTSLCNFFLLLIQLFWLFSLRQALSLINLQKQMQLVFYEFSSTCDWLYVFPRLSRVASFPRLLLVSRFPHWNKLQFFPRLELVARFPELRCYRSFMFFSGITGNCDLPAGWKCWSYMRVNLKTYL